MGVFLAAFRSCVIRRSLPHARGGVSGGALSSQPQAMSSPRPWGCFQCSQLCDVLDFVFPTPVGVFPYDAAFAATIGGLPHARWGVSGHPPAGLPLLLSSPRPWGCFRGGSAVLGGRRVFPTPVGVFLMSASMRRPGRGLPHARGGVSYYGKHLASSRQSSPRPWGCFSRLSSPRRSSWVFPTPVGVFPRLWRSEMARSSLPYTRGGVSIADGTRFAAVKSSPRPWGCF